jgi:hypothetical protein
MSSFAFTHRQSILLSAFPNEERRIGCFHPMDKSNALPCKINLSFTKITQSINLFDYDEAVSLLIWFLRKHNGAAIPAA